MFRLTRFLFITLMLVLLPLRGWAGNIMAVDMVASMTEATVMQAQMVEFASPTTMPADCTMHSQISTDDAAAQCGSCDTCELCLAVANLTHRSWHVGQLTRHSSPLALNASFKSAARASSRKPPIS